MDITQTIVAGVLALPLVVGLVELCKRLGASGNLCLVLALVFGVLLMLLEQFTVVFPDIAPWVKAVITGLVIGLSASGLYDLAKKFIPVKPT